MGMSPPRSAPPARSASIACSAPTATAAVISSSPSWSIASSIPAQSLPPPAPCRQTPPPRASASSWVSGLSARTNSTVPSTGWRCASRQSRRPLPNVISPAARWCSTTCRRAIWKAAAVRSPSSATAVTASVANCRSSTVCCAPPTAVRWRSRCSPAAPAIKALRDAGALQMSLFDERDMAAITAPDFPGERLIVCRNRGLGAERARKREDLLLATERDLARIAAAVARKRRPLRGQAEIGIAVGAVIDQHKMAKHFALAIADTCFTFTRKANEITAEAALDGIYIVRTSLPATALDDTATVRNYKSLSLVERAFRCLKTVDLQIRPVYHWLADRVRAHVFLCMLAYYLEWHMRQRLAPMLYDDTEKDAAEALRASVVAKAERSASAITKQTTGRTEDGLPVHSFRTLLADLATLTQNTLVTALDPQHTLTLTARPTPLQQKAQDLLGLARTQ